MISVSLVTYNTPYDEIKDLILSVLSLHDVIFFIIDNSPGNSIESYLPKADNLFFIDNEKNIGFGSAHNISIDKAINMGSDYHLVLNPDVTIPGGTVEKMIAFMDENPNVGLVMPKVLYPDGRVQMLPKLLPSPWSIVKRRLYLPLKLKNILLQNYELRNISDEFATEVPIISGCFSLFRTSVFKTAGKYDERFFMYFEDFDISRRINKYFKTIYLPNVFVHHGYEAGARRNLRLLRIFIISFLRYFNKWGWIFDKDRKKINKCILQKIQEEN